jgi:site-specific recombinase XerD
MGKMAGAAFWPVVASDHAAATIKLSGIEDWLNAIQEARNLANATIKKMRGTFSMTFRHGKRKNLVNFNPAANVPLRDVSRGIVERFLSADEEMRLRELPHNLSFSLMR